MYSPSSPEPSCYREVLLTPPAIGLPDCCPTPEDRRQSANPGVASNCQHERTDIGCSPTCDITQLPCPRMPGSLEFQNANIDQGSCIGRQLDPREQLLFPFHTDTAQNQSTMPVQAHNDNVEATAIFSSRPPAISRSDLTNVPAGLPRARSITRSSYAHDTLISIVRRSEADEEHELRPWRSPNGDSLHGQCSKVGDERLASRSHKVANFSTMDRLSISSSKNSNIDHSRCNLSSLQNCDYRQFSLQHINKAIYTTFSTSPSSSENRCRGAFKRSRCLGCISRARPCGNRSTPSEL